MRYLIMLKASQPATPPPPELMEAIMSLGAEASAAGVLLDTAGLLPSAAGARVRLSGGRLTVTDGPFAEAKEVLGGYWMIEVASRAEAIAWAKRCPASPNEIIEIRQVQEMADFPPDVQAAAAGFGDLKT
jgi:hypothetical protein